MQDDDLRPSSNIEDRRGQPSGGGGFTVGRGGLGIGAVIVLSLIGWATGIDPRVLIGGAEVVTGGGQPAGQYAPQQSQQQVQAGTPTDAAGTFVAKILGETEDVWSAELPRQANVQ